MKEPVLPHASLTARAQAYLLHNGVTAVYVEQVNVQECCIPLISPPLVHKGVPPKPENFLTLEADGVRIFYDKDLLKPDQVIIDTQSYGFLKTLVIKDWPIAI